jgi:DNA-binding NtrC family response regulator
MRKSRILLVDDEPILLRTLGRALTEAGHEVVSAAGGAEAADRLREGTFDLIVTDIAMEGLGGLELLQMAKKSDPDVSVILITGFCDAASAIEALRNGADDYLSKPFDFDELILRVSRSLEKRELRRKLRLYEDILPVCCGCKQIRDDAGRQPGTGRWMSLEEYLVKEAGVKVSHGYCPACSREYGFKTPEEGTEKR